MTRDEFNQMAWTAVHDNPLVNPGFQNTTVAPSGQYMSGASMAAPSSKLGPYPSSAGLSAPLPSATGAVTFGGMTFKAPQVSQPASGSWQHQQLPQPGHANSWSPSVLGATSAGLPPSRQAAASWTPHPDPPSTAPPTASEFLATPVVVPNVTSEAPTVSMTAALFNTMQHAGFNQMAYEAVHNNALVRPARTSNSLSVSASHRSGASNSPSITCSGRSSYGLHSQVSGYGQSFHNTGVRTSMVAGSKW